MNQREYFNSVADRWDIMCTHDTSRIEKILDLVKIPAGSRILDVGTGTGVLIPFLCSRTGKNGSITAIDYAERMVEIARGRHSFCNVRFIAGDVMNFSFEKGCFDIVICYSMFPHFADKKYAVNRLAGLLSEGGRLAVCHSQSRQEINSIHRDAQSPAVSGDRLPDMAAIKDYFCDAGLTAVTQVDTDELFVAAAIKQ